jgi:hypothetical protein
MFGFRTTRFQFLDLVRPGLKLAPKRGPKVQREHAQPSQWAWDAGDGRGGIVKGFTRSHARAAIKQKLGIKKGRVPMGVSIACVA